MPRMEVAKPTVDAGIPRPPVKMNGREPVSVLESRGVERKRDQRLPNALQKSVRFRGKFGERAEGSHDSPQVEVEKCNCDHNENHIFRPDAPKWQLPS